MDVISTIRYDYFDDAIRKYDKAHQNDDLSDEEYGSGEINNV